MKHFNIFNKELLIYIILVSWLFIVPMAVNAVNQYMVYRQRYTYLSRQYLIENKPEIVFLGSSRFGSGIRPDVFQKKAVILSVEFGNFKELLKVVKANIHFLKKAETIVLEVSPEMLMLKTEKILSYHLESMQELGVPQTSTRSWDFPQKATDIFPYLSHVRWIPRQHLNSPDNRPKENYLHLKKQGFLARKPSSKPRPMSEQVKATLDLVQKHKSPSVIKDNAAALEQILALLKNSPIKKLYVLQMPNSNAYLSLTPASWPPYFDRVIKPILAGFSSIQTIPTPGSCKTSNDYSDALHLTPKAAERLTHEIKSFVRE